MEHFIRLPYLSFKSHVQSRDGLAPRVVPVMISEAGYELYVKDNGILLITELIESLDPASDWQDYLANIKPLLDTSLTREGYVKAPSPVVGPQGYETRLGAMAFELKTDAEAGFTPSEQTPVVEYFRFQMPATLNLISAVIAWEYVPRFTNLTIQVGYYIGPNETDFQAVGEFTLGDGIVLAGINHVGAAYPPDGAWASTQIPSEAAPGVPMFIRTKICRYRTTHKDSNGAELKPYIDVDFNFHRKTA